jgi:hypothetical protein
MQQIVRSLVFQNANPRVLQKIAPEMFERLAAQMHCRVVKTPLPVDGVLERGGRRIQRVTQ